MREGGVTVPIRQPPRVTLEEVARRAGVSPSTVSRVVRGSTHVTPARTRAVQAAIAATGYTPNLAARQLVTRRSDTVAVVIPEEQWRVFADPFFAEMMQGVAARLALTPFRFVLMVGRSREDREWLVDYVASRHVDGVMLVASERRDTLGQAMEHSGVPVVYMGRPSHANRSTRYVDADNVGGVEQVVQYLRKRGRQRVAMVTGVPTMRSSITRTRGYRRGMANAGLGVDESLIVPSDYTDEGGEKAMNRLLERTTRIDAVVAASDLLAVGVLRASRALGIDVPDDIAVVGFGDDRIAAYSHPPLTTVAQNTMGMGTELANLMIAAIEDRPTPRNVIMPTRLVIRGSA